MKRPMMSLMLATTAMILSITVAAQDVHIPERNMPAPVPAGVPEVVELTGQAKSDISNTLLVKYGIPPAIYMAYDPLSKMILVKTDNGPTVYTNRNVEFIFGKTQSGGMGLFTHYEKTIEDRAEALNRPFVIEQMATLKDPIVYKAPNEQYRVSVFVEPQCGYCFKLHTEMDSYHAEGITLVYYPFPIYGEFSESSMARIWSLPKDERADALTDVKNYVNRNRNSMRGKSPDEILSRFDLPEATSTSESLVKKTKAVGQKLEIAGTPAIVLENGRVIGGYLPAQALKQALVEAE